MLVTGCCAGLPPTTCSEAGKRDFAYGVTAVNCFPSFFFVLAVSKLLDQQLAGLLPWSCTMTAVS